jgi:hypothetical protein
MMEELLELVPTRVSDGMKISLDEEFLEKEVKHTLFQMHLSKAP